MVPQWVIEKKRDGQELAEEELRAFIKGFTEGSIPEYQMSALAMAIFFNGMTSSETSTLTDAMMRSGDVLQLSSLTRPTCDKHSTGGIGDKVSLILAPLAAACGLAVPMISGRGLGITGGTLDKLESIPGYRTDLSSTEFEKVIEHCGCSIIGQTANLAPADKKLYALRDVTGTVPSIPLISASIMSKKLAEGAQSLVLDVKWGTGAFMKTKENARQLAQTMINIGANMDRKVSGLLTNMNQPLGLTAGNAVEVKEAIDTLKGDGPDDLVKITIALCAEMLVISGVSKSVDQAMSLARGELESGAALAIFVRMVELQGGDPEIVDRPALLPQPAHTTELKSTSSGWLAEMDAEKIGRAALLLGAGRTSVTDPISHAAGITDLLKVGAQVKEGDVLMRLHADDQTLIEKARAAAESGCVISPEQPEPFELINETIRGD